MPTCMSCNEEVLNNYMETNEDGKVCCDPCITEKNLEQCRDCKDFFAPDEVKSNGYGETMCNDCYDEYN